MADPPRAEASVRRGAGSSRSGSAAAEKNVIGRTGEGSGIPRRRSPRRRSLFRLQLKTNLPYLTNEAFRASHGTRANLESAQIQRFLPPQVMVNGIQLNDQTTTFGPAPGPGNDDGNTNFGAVRGIVDPTLASDRDILVGYRWAAGVDVLQHTHAWASSGIDGDYLLYDLNITNTGNTDEDPAIEHPSALADFRYAYVFQGEMGHIGEFFDGGRDDVVEFFNPWPTYTGTGGEHHTLALYYDGDNTAFPGPDRGSPGGDTEQGGVKIVGADCWTKPAFAIGWIYAESAPGSNTDDPAQPKATAWSGENNYRFSNLGQDFGKQYQKIFAGQDVPGWTYDPANTQRTVRLAEGVTQGSVGVDRRRTSVYQSLAYSSLALNQTVRGIVVVAAGGISDQLSRGIGKRVVARDLAGGAPESRMTSDEIALVRSNVDSVKRTVDRAFWNVYGRDPNGSRWPTKPAAQNRAFNLPDPPRPPAVVWIRSGDGKIILDWTNESAENPDTDTGILDFAGYKVYRFVGSPDSLEGTVGSKVYDVGKVTTFEDADVTRDFVYYYAVTAYDDGSQNWERPGVKLESGKFWTWSGWYDTGARPSGTVAATSADLANIRVVPNPYNVRLDFPAGAQADEITFKNLPQVCTIRIYTTGGTLVHTLSHEFGGSEAWDMRTKNNQFIATGLYIYTVESDLGSKVGKFVVIR